MRGNKPMWRFLRRFFEITCKDCGFFVACKACSERYDAIDEELKRKP